MDNKTKLTCMYLNADVLTNKMTELNFIITNEKPDIVAISEVLPKNSNRVIHKEEFIIPGYEMLARQNI